MESRSLRTYLKQKGEATRAAAVRRPTSADWQESVEATCVASDVTGVAACVPATGSSSVTLARTSADTPPATREDGKDVPIVVE